MAQEVGVAYVTLLPSGRGFGKAVEGQVDDAVGKSQKKTDGFFSKLGKGVKTVALGIAGVATGVAALAVGGGISRALNIEDAQAKLKGLGHDTQSVEAIMKDALASVKGTAFGLDAAATTAAAAVASGIKPGKELEGYLRLTADAATIAGVSMEEMGSIINKVQAKGKAQMEDLNRLTERGIPIMQMLADEYGVTAEEMSKMVSKGEVDAERFRAALEKNVGGAALESGNTFRGAIANMRAALSRLGLVFVEDGLEDAKTFVNEVTTILDGLTERMKPVMDGIKNALGDTFNSEGMGERFLTGIDDLVDVVKNGPIPQLLSALEPALPALKEMSEAVGPVLGDAFKELGKAIEPVLPLIAETLTDAIVQLAPPLTDLLTELIPLIPSLIELAAEVLPLATDLAEFLIPALEGLVEIVTKALEPITALFDLLNGKSSFEEFMASLQEIADAPGTALRAMLDYIDTLKERWDEMVGFFETIRDTVVEVFTNVKEFFEETWDAIGLTIGGALKTIAGLLTGDTDLMKEGINQFLTTIEDWWSDTWNNATSVISDTWNNIVSTIQSKIDEAVTFVKELPGKVQNALTGAKDWLVDTGKDIIRGLIRGVDSMINDAVKSVKNVGGQMLDGVKSFLGIHSPSRVFRDQVGKMVGLGLLEGVSDRAISRRIEAEVNHLVPIPDGVSFAGASVVQNNTFNAAETDDRLLMARAGRFLKEAMA